MTKTASLKLRINGKRFSFEMTNWNQPENKDMTVVLKEVRRRIMAGEFMSLPGGNKYFGTGKL